VLYTSLTKPANLKGLRIGTTGISWKALEGGKTINVTASEIKWAEWTRVARNFQLKIGLKDTWKKETFEGFTNGVGILP
jgi:structure-specific recognition protein 1